MSGALLEERQPSFWGADELPQPTPCSELKRRGCTTITAAETEAKYSDVSNCVACSVCAMTAQAYWNLVTYPCKQTFVHVVPDISRPRRVGSAASSQLC